MEIILFWVGAFFTVLGGLFIWNEREIRMGAKRLPGRVVGYSSGKNTSRRSSMFFPIIQFRSTSGELLFIEGRVGAGAPMYGLGHPIAVFNKPGSHEYCIDSAMSYLIGGILLFLGVAALGIFFSIFRANMFSVLMAIGVSFAVYRSTNKFRQELHKAIAGKSASELLASFRRAMEQDRQPTLLKEHELDQVNWSDPVSLRVALNRRSRSELLSIPLLAVFTLVSIHTSQLLYESTQLFLATAVATEGRVVEMVSSSTSEGTTWAPRVEFQTPDGASHQFKHRISSSHPSYVVGQRVRVLYSPQNPRTSQIDMGIWNFWATLITAGLGLICFLMTWGQWSARRRRLMPQKSSQLGPMPEIPGYPSDWNLPKSA